MKQLGQKEKLFKLILKIPQGKVVSYSDLALKLKTSPRVIGRLLNQNKKLVKIPCHRVVLKNGKIGGYRLGKRLKIFLLKKEGIKIKKDKVLKENFFQF